MLSDASVVTTLPVSDLERARRFYHEMLGLDPLRETPQGLIYEGAGGGRFLLYQTRARPPGEHTQMSFVVADLEAEVGDLKSEGLTFEEYHRQDLTTVGSISYTRSAESAWFRDSEGNLIGITQSTSQDDETRP
jgi:catechol 2,3-dioxygenase-like lactoylglutathione lyase family enzyme